MVTEAWATKGYIVRTARLCLVFRDWHTVSRPIRDCLIVLNTNVLIPSRELNFKKSKRISSEEPDYKCQSTGTSTQSSRALEAGRVIIVDQRRIKMKVWAWVCGETGRLFIVTDSYLLAKTVVLWYIHIAYEYRHMLVSAWFNASHPGVDKSPDVTFPRDLPSPAHLSHSFQLTHFPTACSTFFLTYCGG